MARDLTDRKMAFCPLLFEYNGGDMANPHNSAPYASGYCNRPYNCETCPVFSRYAVRLIVPHMWLCPVCIADSKHQNGKLRWIYSEYYSEGLCDHCGADSFLLTHVVIKPKRLYKEE